MRRATFLIAVALAAATPARAGECALEPLEDGPLARVERTARGGGRVEIEWRYPTAFGNCVKDRGGALALEVHAGHGGASTLLETTKLEVRAGRPGGMVVETRSVAYSQICAERVARSPRPELYEAAGRRRLGRAVELEARLVGEGAARPLSARAPKVTFHCPACPEPRGGLSVRQEREGLWIKGDVDASWLACARKDGALSARLFFGDSNAEVTQAVRPDLELSGLEKQLARKGERYELEVSVPMPRLCGRGKRFLAVEFWGRGELARLDGGGRSHYRLDACGAGKQ